jgi:hypothetical protein
VIDRTLDFKLDDDPSALKRMVEVIHPILDLTDSSPWRIDCSRAEYLGPLTAAVLAATALEADRRGQVHQVPLPASPPEAAAFATFSGLAHLLQGSPRPDPNHPLNETIAIEPFTRAVFNQSDPILRLIRRHVEMTADSEDYLRLCFNEVAQNIEDHAQSPIGGVSCARFMRNLQETRVAIVDRGVGIWGSLRPTHPELKSDRMALEGVLRGRVTSRSRRNNQGLGLSKANIVIGQKGRMILWSGRGVAEIAPGRKDIFDHRIRFPGTIVFFALPLAASDAEDPVLA